MKRSYHAALELQGECLGVFDLDRLAAHVSAERRYLLYAISGEKVNLVHILHLENVHRKQLSQKSLLNDLASPLHAATEFR